MLKYGESWDIYDTANVTDVWQANSGTIVPSQGRCGSAAIYHNNGGGPSIGVATSEDGGFAGWAYKPEAFGVGANFMIGNTTGLNPGDVLGFARVVGSGAVEFWKGPNTTIGGLVATTAAGLVSLGHYTAIGLEWKFSVTGYMRIYINGVLAADSGSVDTTNFWTSGQWGTLFFGAIGHMDDHYFGDTDASNPLNPAAAYLGDQHFEGQVVDTEGFYQDWALSAGTDAVALVNEIPPDDGATYVSSSTPGQKTTFGFPPIVPLSGPVSAVILMPNLVKTAFATRTIRNLWRAGGVNANGATQALAATDFRYYPEVAGRHPITSAAWTVATANAVEGGVEVVA